MLFKMENDDAEDVEHSVVYDNDYDDADWNDVFAWGNMEELLSFSCIREMFEWVQNLVNILKFINYDYKELEIYLFLILSLRRVLQNSNTAHLATRVCGENF